MKRFLTILLGCFTPSPAVAAGVHITNYSWKCTGFLKCNPSGGPPAADVVTDMIMNLINGITYFIFWFAVVVFFYGALRMAASRGDEGKETGKKALIYASLGLVGAVLVKAILQFVCQSVYSVGGGLASGTCPLWP